MKSLNPTVRENPVIIKNPEGGSLFKLNSDINLLAIGSSFKLRDSAYWSAAQKLSILESAIDEEKDLVYKLGLSVFLSEYLGIRLSPVVMLSRISKSVLSNTDKSLVAKAVNRVMDRPDKIANAIAYAQFAYGCGKELPAYFKRALKSAFENFDAYTLRKFKLKNKKVKTADVIKLLHPRPRNKVMSALYKAIIENSKESAIEKGRVITEVLSDASLTKVEKETWINSNISKMPLNALLRNLGNIEDTDENISTIRQRILHSIKVIRGLPLTKVFNPFDLLSILDGKVSDRKRFMLLEMVSAFIQSVDLGIEGKNIKFLVDVSGSMRNDPINNVRKYFTILVPMLAKKNKLSFSSFNTRLYNVDAEFNNNRMDAQSIYEKFLRIFRPDGGTALLDSLAKIVRDEHPDLIVVFSDEITWADTDVDLKLKIGVPVIAVNPSPLSSGTVFSPKAKVVKLSSIDAKIFYFLPVITDFKAFKNFIKSLI